jgi:hypothetical protein
MMIQSKSRSRDWFSEEKAIRESRLIVPSSYRCEGWLVNYLRLVTLKNMRAIRLYRCCFSLICFIKNKYNIVAIFITKFHWMRLEIVAIFHIVTHIHNELNKFHQRFLHYHHEIESSTSWYNHNKLCLIENFIFYMVKTSLTLSSSH